MSTSSQDHNTPALPTESVSPLIVPRPEHTISRQQISPKALKVLYGLKDAGFDAYLVGGCVRDLLLGITPKDFDVATNASPEQVHKLFKRSRLIGRRFKLVHVSFGREIIEVATFRAPPEMVEHVDQQGRIVQDNVFGTIEQDAWRRDFTINALYYNIKDFSIVDYTGGMADLKAGKIRLIGDVETRYREDPVRMLRALRFVAKLGLTLDAETEAPIRSLASLLADIPPARLFDEILKLYLSGNAVNTHALLAQFDILPQLLPDSAECLVMSPDSAEAKLIQHALINTDKRISEDKPVTPAFLFAALLWPKVASLWSDYQQKNMPAIPALQRAAMDAISRQVQRIAVPKRFTLVARDIWQLQIRLTQRHGKRAWRCLAQPKFRAGYDFLLLRVEAGEPHQELADWWTEFQQVDEQQQSEMVAGLAPDKRRPRRRRRRRRASTANKPAADKSS